VLRARGISEEAVGAPVRATMDSDTLGELRWHPPVHGPSGQEADGIVSSTGSNPTPILSANRERPAQDDCHRLGQPDRSGTLPPPVRSPRQYEIISSAGRELLKRCRVLFGLGLVENQKHETAVVKIARAEEIESMEVELLKKARACWPPCLWMKLIC